MLFRQLFDLDTSTYTYLLADEANREAVLIDPVVEQVQRDATLIEELELELIAVLETHVHADHVTAQGLLRRRFGARSFISERSGAVCADVLVKQGDRITFGRHQLEVRETPGHTSGCVTYVGHEPRLAFTGDALLVRGCGRTDFQQGSARQLYQSVREQVFTLPDDTLIYPAHDYKGRTVTSVGEERRHNPRLGDGKSLEEFVQIMESLALPYPRKMDLAVPANLVCGLMEDRGRELPVDMTWAPIEISAGGVPEVSPEWLEAQASDIQLLDVRETDEFRGELGHIAGSDLVPLRSLEARLPTLSRDRPVVTVCRSGGRSGQAAVLLRSKGFARVASLRGGLLEWRRQGLPVAYGWAVGHASSRQG